MLNPRIIPCLLIKNGAVIKTIQFSNEKYIGDPLNAVRIFNEKEVDELIVIDIGATVNNNQINLNLIANLAKECRMPLCYAGGVNKVEDVERLISLGVEKVGLSSSIINNESIILNAAERVGNQSIVAIFDVRFSNQSDNPYHVYINNGKTRIQKSLNDLVDYVQKNGAGEILINSIDRDGTLLGYDKKLIEFLYTRIDTPFTIMGGASSINDFKFVISNFGNLGLAAGSMFVLKGKHRAVLIQYLDKLQKEELNKILNNL